MSTSTVIQSIDYVFPSDASVQSNRLELGELQPRIRIQSTFVPNVGETVRFGEHTYKVLYREYIIGTAFSELLKVYLA